MPKKVSNIKECVTNVMSIWLHILLFLKAKTSPVVEQKIFTGEYFCYFEALKKSINKSR